jgi:hypothetical protein
MSSAVFETTRRPAMDVPREATLSIRRFDQCSQAVVVNRAASVGRASTIVSIDADRTPTKMLPRDRVSPESN